MKHFALFATAAIVVGSLLTGCSKEPDPNETGSVVKGLPPGGAPPDAKRPKGPFDDAPPGAPMGPLGKKGGMAPAAPAAAPAPGAPAGAPATGK